MRAARATTARVAALALALAACAACSSRSGAGTNPPAATILQHRERRNHVPRPAHRRRPHRTGRPLAPHGLGSPARPLAFRATTVDGTAFAGAELAGKKTVLWFWAPWCTVCAARRRRRQGRRRRAGPDVRVIGVAGLSTDAADMRRFVERGGLQSMTSLADTTGDLYTRFGITQQDTFVLVGPDGTVTRHPAYSQDVDLVALARKTFG